MSAFAFAATFTTDSGRPLISTTTTGLPSANIAVREFVLLADEIEAAAVAEMVVGPGLAARLLGVADREHDQVGLSGDLDRLGDQLAIPRRVGEHYLVGRAILCLRDAHALGVSDSQCGVPPAPRCPCASEIACRGMAE